MYDLIIIMFWGIRVLQRARNVKIFTQTDISPSLKNYIALHIEF